MSLDSQTRFRSHGHENFKHSFENICKYIGTEQNVVSVLFLFVDLRVAPIP